MRRVNVDADAGGTEVSCEQAEHLALSACEVQQPRALPDAAGVTDQQQLVYRWRVHDPMGGLGDLVVSEDADHGGPLTSSSS
jgi:hypothetical protein